MASASSYTAFATSVTSARVGMGFSIMDSSMCVATITRLPFWAQSRIIRRCTLGNFSMAISTPRSPRATMTPSETSIISLIFLTPSWSSIFEITLILSALSPRSSRNWWISSTSRTNDRAIKSTSCSIENKISRLSFSVIAGRLTRMPGKLTWRLLLRTPPSMTLHCITRSSLLRISRLIRPLSTVIISPICTSLIRSS